MLTLFFVPDLGVGNSIEVTGDEAHHAMKVLRLEVGEEILLADGSGAWVRGRVDAIAKKSFTLAAVERGYREEVTPELIVVQALMKSSRAHYCAGLNEI